MEKETMGTVISVTKQWWLKINNKSTRVHAMDGATFPFLIKVKYEVKKAILVGNGLVQVIMFRIKKVWYMFFTVKIIHQNQE